MYSLAISSPQGLSILIGDLFLGVIDPWELVGEIGVSKVTLEVVAWLLEIELFVALMRNKIIIILIFSFLYNLGGK